MLWLILQQLKSGNAGTRRQAAERLGDLESPKALAGLTKAVGDVDPLVRIAVVNALGRIEDDRKLDPLLRACRDSKSEVRLAAINQMKGFGGERVQAMLVGALRDSDAVVRARAARFLDRLSWQPVELEDEVALAIARGQLSRAAGLGAAAIRPLESILLDESARGLHVTAIQALGAVADERVVKSLVRALRLPDPTVCVAAIEALANAGGNDTIKDLAPLLKHKDNRIRTATIEALARFDASAQAPEFRNLLRDPALDVRSAAAAALAKSTDPATVDALVAALKDKYEDVRCTAANSLGRIRDVRAIGPLILTLKDPGTNVRKIAAGALTMIDPKWTASEAARKMVPELRSALASTDWVVRNAAAGILKQLGDDSTTASVLPGGAEMVTPARRRQQVVVGAFVGLLQDGDSDLRLAAAFALGQLRDHGARSPLMSAMSDPDPLVRITATEALSNLGVE